tara:strand:- start:380 stop:727 length:348 start_codon:yes stop_codon:yes gene_type:complete
MKLTGKCKEDFEKWYIVIFLKHSLKYYESTDKNTMEFVRIDLKTFYTKNESMQYGVYVDFFDSAYIECPVLRYQKNQFSYVVSLNDKNHMGGEVYKTRPEARTAAIEKANEIYNN